MKTNRRLIALALAGTLSLSLLAGCSSTAAGTGSEDTASDDTGALAIADQGIFSAGGTVITSDGTFDVSNYYTSARVPPRMWITPMCSTRSRRRRPACRWYSCTATASPAWAG